MSSGCDPTVFLKIIFVYQDRKKYSCATHSNWKKWWKKNQEKKTMTIFFFGDNQLCIMLNFISHYQYSIDLVSCRAIRMKWILKKMYACMECHELKWGKLMTELCLFVIVRTKNEQGCWLKKNKIQVKKKTFLMHADIFFLFLCLPFFPEMKVQLQPSKRWVVFQSSPNAKNSQPCVWSSKTRRKQLTLWTTFAQQQNNFSLKHVKSILFGCKKKKKNACIQRTHHKLLGLQPLPHSSHPPPQSNTEPIFFLLERQWPLGGQQRAAGLSGCKALWDGRGDNIRPLRGPGGIVRKKQNGRTK